MKSYSKCLLEIVTKVITNCTHHDSKCSFSGSISTQPMQTITARSFRLLNTDELYKVELVPLGLQLDDLFTTITERF